MNQNIRTRQILHSDCIDVVGLLTKGFPRKDRRYWERALERLATRRVPEGYPRFGYLLQTAEIVVGVLLLIYTDFESDDKSVIRCNVSSWYVDPAYRSYATLLTARAFQYKKVTYINISPAPHVQPIIEIQRFSRYSSGQAAVVPILGTAAPRIQLSDAELVPDVSFDRNEYELLREHIKYGCLGVWCATSVSAMPFVFARRLVKGFVPCAQLIYARSVDDFVSFARPLGWYLFARGCPFVIVDSNGPIGGVFGRYFEGVAPKYFRGPRKPKLGDLAYTEAALFGI